MRTAALLAGLSAVFVVFFVTTDVASASPIKENEQLINIFEADEKASSTQIAKLIEDDKSGNKPQKQAKSKTQSQPKSYKVQPGETLSDIASKHNVTWQQIFNKNEKIDNPHVISVGDEIKIPKPNEKLKARQVPQPEPVVEQVTQEASQTIAAQPAAPAPQPVATPSPTPAPSSAGNTYYYGYCTYYAKSRRPDLPNNLGNADTWVMRAASQGIATGSSPRVGAIGQQGMHVVYVEQVHGDGTVTVSEMNFNGWGVISSRRVPASYFAYIY